MPVVYTTAYFSLVHHCRLQEGERVLIHAAAGGVGTMIQHIAKHLGLTIIASISSDKQDYARALGADYVVDYKTENLVERVKGSPMAAVWISP